MQAAGAVRERARRTVVAAAGAARHAAWYGAYLLDGRRGARPDRDD